MAKIFTGNMGGVYSHGGGQAAKFITRNAGGFHPHLWPKPGIAYSNVSGFDIVFFVDGLSSQTFPRLYLEGYPVDKLLAGKPLDKLLEGYPVIRKLTGKPTS